MKDRPKDVLVLTLPADPELALLARMVSAHFFRQHGVGALAARRGARVVESRCRPLLKPPGRDTAERGESVVLQLRPGPGHLEVHGRRDGAPEVCLIRLARPAAR